MDGQYKGVTNKTNSTTVHEPAPRSMAQPLPEIPQGQYPSTHIRADSKNDDLVYNLTRREVHDYESLNRGLQPLQQPEHATSPQNRSGPVSSDPSSSFPSISHTSMSAATSPPKDSSTRQLATDNTRPFPSSSLQQPVSPNLQSADSADEIVELQCKSHDAGAAERKHSPAGRTRKETEEVSNIPNTNFAIACMVTFCFNLPLGILAMYFSLKAVRAFQDGHTKLGEKRSRWSIFVSLLGIAITTVLVSSIVLYIAIQGQKRISQNRAYSVKTGISL